MSKRNGKKARQNGYPMAGTLNLAKGGKLSVPRPPLVPLPTAAATPRQAAIGG